MNIEALPLAVALSLAIQDPGSGGSPDAAPAPLMTQAELEALSLEVSGQVAALRGTPFKRPVKVELANKARIIEYMTMMTEELSSEEELRREGLRYQVLGLFDPEDDIVELSKSFYSSQVAGFYDPMAEAFFLVDTMPASMAGMIMAHELTHALDDQYFPLDVPMKAKHDQTDALLAFMSVAEGSGMQTMSAWMGEHLDMAAMGDMAGMMAEQTAALGAILLLMALAQFAVYTQGLAFLQAGGDGALEKAFANPPRSTEQVLHPEKYWDPAAADEPLSVTLNAADVRGWELLDEGTLGELMLALLTEPQEGGELTLADVMALQSGPFTNLSASGWGGDRFALLGKDDALVFVSVSAWDSPVEAAEFRGALSVLGDDMGRKARALAAARSSKDTAPGGFRLLETEAPDEVRFLIAVGASTSKAERALRKLDVARSAD